MTARCVYTVQEGDIGRRTLAIEGQLIDVGDVCGPMQPIDVGKRIFESGGVLQIENESQLNRRQRRQRKD